MKKGGKLKQKTISKRLLLGITLFDPRNRDYGEWTQPYTVRMVSFKKMSYNTLTLMPELTHTIMN